ncbi:MAG: ABC transporter permease [Candidatus Bathyarchaeia archaeon]
MESKRSQRRLKELRYSFHLLWNSPLTLIGIVLALVVIVIALIAPLIAPYGPEQRIWTDKIAPPSMSHLLGTDDTGGDIFSRILYGYRLDLAIASSVVLVAVIFGCVLGSISGFLGGRIEEGLMRITDVFLSIPSLILAMSIAVVMGRSVLNLALAMAITWWPAYARLIRGQVMVEKQKLYVDAAKAYGIGNIRILFHHIVPNSIYPVMVKATLDLGAAILTTAALSFLGFGVEPGAAELGRMVADGRQFVFSAPWIVSAPGVAIFVLCLGLNLVGDGLRDILDPRLRR